MHFLSQIHSAVREMASGTYPRNGELEQVTRATSFFALALCSLLDIMLQS